MKIKVLVITMHSIKNYGSVLQTLATQEKLKEFGADVMFANFIRRNVLDSNIIKSWGSSSKKPRSKAKKLITSVVLYPTVKRWCKIFNGFLKEHINVVGEVSTTQEDLIKTIPEADVYCTGSDQVWNSGWNSGILKPYFLDFAPEGKRLISYSASFGKSELEEWEKPETKKLLQRYNCISVREKSGISILEDLGINNAIHLLDPTLVVDEAFWKKYIKRRVIKERYILIYQLNANKEFDRYAKNLADKKGLKLIRLCTRFDQIIKTGKSVAVPTVNEWLSLFYYADHIITDSFHGTAFSINFKKNVIAIYPKNYGGRIDSILELVHMKERHLTDYSDFSIADKEIDYEKVNKILSIERKKADEFLKEALFGA
jgi:hypothetical protein